MWRAWILLVFAVAGCTDDASDDASDDGAPAELALADGVHIEAVSLYQGVKIELVAGGVPVASHIPVLSDRDALMRVFFTLDAGHEGAAVVGRLSVAGALVAETPATPTGPSDEAVLASTLNFDVPGAVLANGPSWRVEIVAADGASQKTNEDARFPRTGEVTFASQPAGPPLEVLLVPIAYDADGSGRLPDTSPEQLALYRQWLVGTYPIRDVALTVGDVVSTADLLSWDGAGWDDLLDRLYTLRPNLGVGGQVYVYGLVSPHVDFASYCLGDCLEGISFFDDVLDPSLRVGFGLGFSGERSAVTLVHEVGHQLGRDHAPCAVQDVDPAYPYANGSIGTWGFDAARQLLLAPDTTVDFMSYCEPTWVSDYTYLGLLERIRAVTPLSLEAAPHRVFRLRGDVLEPLGVVSRPRGPSRTVEGTLDGERVTLRGTYAGYDHLPGGLLAVPTEPTE